MIIPIARIPFVLEVIFALAKAGISSDPGALKDLIIQSSDSNLSKAAPVISLIKSVYQLVWIIRISSFLVIFKTYYFNVKSRNIIILSWGT